MLALSQIIPIFFAHYTLGTIQETPDFLTVVANCSGPQDGLETALSALFAGQPYADQWQITIELDDMPFTYNSTSSQQQEFFDAWQNLCKDWDGSDSCTLTINVKKHVHEDNMLFVYDQTVFFEYLSRLKVAECISIVSSLLKKCKGPVLFITGGLSQPAATGSLYFLSDIPTPDARPVMDTDHKKAWERLKSVSHFSGINDCIALPSDFSLENIGSLPAPLTTQFEKCTLVLLLALFFDMMTIRENTMIGKLNGYKTINVTFDVTRLNTASLATYHKIYIWLLSGGNLQDKMGIIRNLVSLNVDPKDQHTLPDSVYPSILSGFKVYERQNIKQYIELRNKMSDQLIGFSEKAGKIVESFSGSFQKSALAVLSLYASVVALRVLSSKDLLGAFTMEATVLTLVFLLISFIFFLISRWDARQQRLRYTESYDNMKIRNEDLLTKEDIEKILNNDSEYQADLTMIDGKLREYSFMWLALLLLLTMFTLLMFYLNQIK